MSTPALPKEEIEAALSRVLASETFAAVARLRKFLKYVVDVTLADQQDNIKETVIAIDVYGRDADFDPRTNPMVRVDASRLRRRLKEYYTEEGQADDLRIELPKGTYVPRFIHLENSRQFTTTGGEQGVPEASTLPSIVVCEFATIGEEHTYLGRGLTEEIKHQLHRFADLRVMASLSNFRDEVIDEVIKEAKAAGADYLLRGSVQSSGSRIRVIAELQRLQTGEQLWSERWERNLDSKTLFELQDEIAERTAGNVASAYGAISRDRLRQSSALGPKNLSTFEWTVRYYDYQRYETAQVNQMLEEVFTNVTAKEPENAPAWAIMSHLVLDRWRFGFDPKAQRNSSLAQAHDHASRALSIDPTSTLAMTTQACICTHRHDYDGFVNVANRIMAVNPCDARSIGWIALNYALFGAWEPAQVYAKRARALNPLDVSTADLSEVFHALSRESYADAWQFISPYRHLEILWAQFFVMVCAQKVGRHDVAQEIFAKIVDMGLDLDDELRKYPFQRIPSPGCSKSSKISPFPSRTAQAGRTLRSTAVDNRCLTGPARMKTT